MDWINFKNELLESSEGDYIFLNVLAGDVKFYLGGKASYEEIKEVTLKLIKELMQEKRINIYFINEKEKQIALFNSDSEINLIITKIHEEWNRLGNSEILPNQVVWLKAKEFDGIDYYTIL